MRHFALRLLGGNFGVMDGQRSLGGKRAEAKWMGLGLPVVNNILKYPYAIDKSNLTYIYILCMYVYIYIYIYIHIYIYVYTHKERI